MPYPLMILISNILPVCESLEKHVLSLLLNKFGCSRGGDKISTKLNFTDSFASVQGPSDCGGKHSSGGNNRFSVISELELQV